MSNNSMKNLFSKSLRSKQTGVSILSVILFVSVISFVLFRRNENILLHLTVNGRTTRNITHMQIQLKTY